MHSEKGHGGGWSLARKLDMVTLGEVYDALGMTAPFRIAQADGTARCLLERAANRVVGRALAEAVCRSDDTEARTVRADGRTRHLDLFHGIL